MVKGSSDDREFPTRREVIETGGAVLAGGLVAGCMGKSGSNESRNGSNRAKNESSGSENTSYSVTMEPVGEVSFKRPPESVAHYFPGYADMAVALGHGDSINSIGLPSRYHTDVYDELDGVSVDKEKITKLIGDGGIDKEVFYELNSDLHLIDPKWLVNNSFFGLENEDIDKISENVAPFLGNTIFRRTDGWHDYRYYTMYEAFEKVAKVHREHEKFRSFANLHDNFIADIQSRLPPADERPDALLCFAASDQPEKFSPYRLTDKGTNKKQFHDLGIEDALSGTGIEGLSTTDRGKIDYETMLEVDPDSILVRGHEDKTAKEFRDTVVAFMENHSVASKLSAVKERKVYRGGPIYTGPIHNLFLTERYAKLYFTDTFSGEMFDRQKLSGIIN